MELDDLPVIDWELAIQLAGNQKALAKDMLDLLTRDIDADRIAIRGLYQSQNYPELLRRVHKLHGALCYCGLPRLKSIIACLESDLKNNITTHLSSLLDQFDSEVALLLKHYANYKAKEMSKN